MGRRTSKAEYSISEPMKLEDLRWLVEQCAGLSGNASVTVKDHKSFTPTDWDEASITVRGDTD